MRKKLQHLLLLLFAAHGCSAVRVTSMETVIATTPTSTPCSELDPVTNRMQWAQQCAMAPSNVMPSINSPAASTTCSGAGCSSRETTSTRSSKTTVKSGETSRTTSNKSSAKSSSTNTKSRERTTRKSISTRTSVRTSKRTSTATNAHHTPSSSSVPSDTDHSSSPGIGSIAGLIIGIVATLILGWLLWRTKDRWLGYLPCFHGDHFDTDDPYWRDGGRFRSVYSSQSPMPPKFSFSRSNEEFGDSPTAPYDVRNLGAGAKGVTDYGCGRSYAVMNPDPPSASTVTAQQRPEELVRAHDPRAPDRDGDDDDSQHYDSDTSFSRKDSVQLSTEEESDSDGDESGSENDDDDEDEAESRTTESQIVDSYQSRHPSRQSESDDPSPTTSHATSSSEEEDGLPETPSPLAPPPAAYVPFSPATMEFRGARADWKRAPPGGSKLAG